MNILKQDARTKILLGQDGNSLVFLLAINVIGYVILSFWKIIYQLNNSTAEVFKAQIFSWLTVPAQPSVFATRPWSLVSFMFSHIEFWDIFSGMVWLCTFGYILQSLAGNRKLIPVYLYGGLVGALAFLLSVNAIPLIRININSVYPLSGSGPAVMAVALAATLLAPKYRIFPMINLPLWGLTAVYVFIKLGTAGAGNIGQAIALIAGGLAGIFFAWQLQKGNDTGQWMSDVVNWANDLFNPEKKKNIYAPKEQFFYKANQKPYHKTPHITQQRVDDLLDKIHSKGYHSLTEEEKDFLKKASAEEL